MTNSGNNSQAIKAKSSAGDPLVTCPACRSRVTEEEIDRSRTGAATRNETIEAVRLRRAAHKARKSGDMRSAVENDQLARSMSDVDARNATEDPGKPGPDQCPVCETDEVTVSESALSPSGARALARSRRDHTTRVVDEARERKSAGSRAAMAERNKQAKARRSALQQARGGRYVS